MAHKRKKTTHSDDGLKLIQQCPMCETAYEPLEIKVLDEEENKHLVHVTCAKCKHSVVALITSQPSGVSSVGLITDALPEDVQRFKESDAVDFDDCIAWHELLSSDHLIKETFLT